MIRQAISFTLFLLLASFLLESPSESRMIRREAAGETQTPAPVDSEEPKAEPNPSSTESSSVGNEPETPEGNEIGGRKPEEESSKIPEGDVKGEGATKGGESGKGDASQSGEPEEGEASQGGEPGEESHGGQPGDASQDGEPGEASHDEELGEDDSQGGESEDDSQDGEPAEEESPGENGDFDHHMIHTGFIFDSPIFSFEAAENYFRSLENAMHEIFKKAMSEANSYPDNYKNTTYDEITVNGQKYRVQKTVVKQGGDDNSTLLIKAVSAVPVERKRRSLTESEMWTI